MSELTYHHHARDLNRELKAAIPAERLAFLHTRQPWRHFLIVLRQVVLLVGLPIVIYHATIFWVWFPASVLLGFVVFSFSILLHEAIHKCIFGQDRWGLTVVLGTLYGWVSGLAYSQFKRWHLDHHDHLGSTDADPKRAHLSPKIHAVWYKLLYCTPVLFPIYFQGVAKTLKGYPGALRQRIKKERMVGIALHLIVLAWFWSLDPWFAVKAHVIPVFFVFPIAFTLNRLAQHYVINPDDVAQWATPMASNRFWNFLFLFSTHHLEHHYFPGVPFYNLGKLQNELIPFFDRKQMVLIHYSTLIYLWFFKNHVPHTRLEP
jgi:fatty acid desaturase